MRNVSVPGVAAALIIAFVLSPLGLAAQETRGATVIVTKLNGSRQSGELIAVKPDSLLLLSPAGGDISVGRGEIQKVRIVRKSPTGFLILFGALAGAGAMGSNAGQDNDFLGLAACIGGALGALGATAGGAFMSIDRELVLAGEADDDVAARLDILRRYSREARSAEAASPRRRPRFRLGFGSAMSFRSERWGSRLTDVPWIFRGDVPPGEEGPHVGSLMQGRQIGLDWASWGPVSLAYDWAEHWSSEIELFFRGEERQGYGWTEARFVSTADGLTYRASIGYDQVAKFSAVLAGLSYRPIAAVRGGRWSVELGAAAGPARISAESSYMTIPAEKKTVLSYRIHAAADRFLNRNLFLGVFCSYRRCQATFSDAVGTAEASFWEVNDTLNEGEPIVRPVQVTIPSQSYSFSGVTYGVRIGFRI
ncbi:MAG TPA: hypothetical protein P5119_12310 [Candidatus Aminicenantes bacterium]|nr:hypothetical protein [Candidatus Aminicenantes bacterium]HRY66107.1 hypothetical protein [Candidatus Aminicenantes bacterium]HRZ73021.1 hypothetical protein [Candidatus Aminicenantes bacterium]